MIAAWTSRKIFSYWDDTVAAVWQVPSQLVSGRLRFRLLAVEAIAEALFLVVHAAMLPEGTQFLGFTKPLAVWAIASSTILSGNFLAIYSLHSVRNPEEKRKLA